MNDDASGFQRIEAREIDTIGECLVARETTHPLTTIEQKSWTGTEGIIKKIRETVGDRPVYLSIDVRRPVPFPVSV